MAGDARALARLISLVEDEDPSARAALAILYPRTGRAHLVGITGAPGTGKSTLVNEMAKVYRRRELTVGIVAVDPTSPFSGGAILGDRVRMRELAGDPGIFIRSMATRGSLGGLARATSDAVKVLDAAGYDRVLIETVGAGQAEVDIAKTAHTTIVVEAPGFGDDIQAIKAGILEIADVFAVNKADREGADSTVTALEMMLDLNGTQVGRWRPPIIKTVAIRGDGVPDLVDRVEAHYDHLRDSGLLARKEEERVRDELVALLQHELTQALLASLRPGELDEWVRRVARREADPYAAAQSLVHRRSR
ncbi:MAG: methylmalonyl Co-A mutase-associated GTPase MeaB [Anaerolineae bacterium]|nr:methylmalonyl Co-A mutase-associated GTPase MeaB [Anaerolineae bacterium]